MRMSKIFILIVLIALCAISLGLVMPVTASPQAQVFYNTPTALPDGRILYKVKAGDTCISVSLLTGVSMDELRLNNNLTTDCVLVEGRDLLLGTVAPEPTASGPTLTPTPLLPTPTPFNGTGSICVLLFNDINGNAMLEEGETPMVGGAISITDRDGKVSLTGITTGAEKPTCFEDLTEGEYTISMAVPEGHNPTTRLNYSLDLKAGDISTLDFGAQLSSSAQPTPVSEGGRSPILAILGGLVIIAGVGMAIYARLITRR